MPVSSADIRLVAGIQDEITGRLPEINRAAERTARRIGAVSAAGSAFALAAGRDFDRATTTIVQGTGATGEALEGLQASYRRLAGTVAGAGNDSVAAAIADVSTKFRLTGPALESMTTKVLQARQAFGEFEIEEFGRAMAVFGVEAEDAGGRLDLFGAVAQDTGAPIGKLIGQAQQFGPTLKNLGLEVDESTVFLGKMHAAGVDITRVMPGLSSAMRRAAEDGVVDLRGHLEGAIQTIGEAETDVEALRIATDTFGAEGAQRMSAAIRSGMIPALSDLGQVYGETGGLTGRLYAETETLGDRLGMLRDRALALVGPVGDSAGAIGSVASAALLAAPQLGAVGKAATTAAGLVKGLGVALVTPPLGLVVGLGAAALAARALYDELDSREVREFTAEIEGLTDAQRAQTIAQLEQTVAVSEARLDNREFREHWSAISAQLEVAERKLEALRQTQEEATAETRAATISTDEMSDATETASVRTEELGDALRETGGAAQEIRARMLTAISEVSDFLEAEALAATGRWRAEWTDLAREVPDTVVREIVGNPAWADLAPEVAGFTWGPDAQAAAASEAMEASRDAAREAAAGFAEDVAGAVLRGQSMAEAMRSALGAGVVRSAVEAGADRLGGLMAGGIEQVLGSRLAAAFAGPLAGLAAGFIGSVAGRLAGAVASAFSGGNAGEARDRGADRFAQTADGAIYRVGGVWQDEDGNEVDAPAPGSGGGDRPVVTAAAGTGGIQDFGAGTPALLHGREGVFTEDAIVRMIGAAAGGSGGGRTIHVHVEVDGQEIAEAVVRNTPETVDRLGF